jgi:hypothetical protein
MLSYRVASGDPPGYRIKFDGIEIESIALRRQHVEIAMFGTGGSIRCP